MWLAMILVCANPAAVSCIVYANTQKVFYEEAACNEEVSAVQKDLASRNLYAVPYCFKVTTGTST